MGENFSLLQRPMYAENILDKGDLVVSKIKVDHLAEKTAAHNIIGDNPILGNAPILTLTGTMNANGNPIHCGARKKYVASDIVVAQVAAEQNMYTNFPNFVIPFGMFAPGSTVRVKYTAKKGDATAANVLLKDSAGSTLFTDTLTTSFQTFTHDITITADGGAVSTSIGVWNSTGAAYGRVMDVQLCATAEALDTTPQGMVGP